MQARVASPRIASGSLKSVPRVVLRRCTATLLRPPEGPGRAAPPGVRQRTLNLTSRERLQLAAANTVGAVSHVVLMPPRGHYVARDIGRLAGVSGGTIGQWANYGYIRASQSPPGEYPRVYSFQDVAEAILVHELIEQKVPLKALRPFIEGLRDEYGDWPLQHAELETVGAEGVSVASVLHRRGAERYELGEHGWQMVEGTTVDPQRVVADLHRGGWAVRELPNLNHIEVDPDRLSGRPAIRGSRVPVSLVAELVDEPDGIEALHEDYDLTDDQIDDARRWWAATTGYEHRTAA